MRVAQNTVWPKKVLPFDNSSNNDLLFYCFNIFRFQSFIHRLRFWHPNPRDLNHSNPIKTLGDKITFSWEEKFGKFWKKQGGLLMNILSILCHLHAEEGYGHHLASIFIGSPSNQQWKSLKLLLSNYHMNRNCWIALKGLIQAASNKCLRTVQKNIMWSFIQHVFCNEIVFWGLFSCFAQMDLIILSELYDMFA